MTRRTLDQIIRHGQALTELTDDQQNEIADLFESYEPTPEDFAREPSPEIKLFLAAQHRAAAEQEVIDAVNAARHARLAWTTIGETLGTSGEAARQRYRDLVA